MTDTPIDRESVERLARDCQRLGDRADKNNLDGQYTRTLWKAQDTLLALRAALNEAEARADCEERHAEEWMLAARAMEQKLASMGDAIDRAAQEARAVALQEAAQTIKAGMADSEWFNPYRAILALLDTPAAEALERVRQEEREACAKRAEGYSTCGCGESKCMAEDDCQIERDAAGRIAAAIRARREGDTT